MSIGTDPALWTLLAFAIGLALVVFFPRAVARAMSYLPGHSGHLLNTEETGAFNAAMALPDLIVQPSKLDIPDGYRDFVRSRPPETHIQFALIGEDLVFRIPRAETRKTTPSAIRSLLSARLTVMALIYSPLFLFGVVAIQYMCFYGIQTQLAVFQEDPRSATIISMLVAASILLILGEIYVVKFIFDILAAEFGSQYVLALHDRIVVCKKLSVFRHAQIYPVSSVRQWTPPLEEGEFAGQVMVIADFGNARVIFPTEDDARWICQGLSVRYAAREDARKS